MSRAQRVLLLSARVGAGHIRAADALVTSLRQLAPDVCVEHWDALEHANYFFRKTFLAVYGALVTRCPSLWRVIYENTERKPAGGGMSRWSARASHFNARRLIRRVREFGPDRVICTHYVAAEIMAIERRRKRLRAQLSVVLTDYAIHPMWVQDGVDAYFVATEEMARNLRAKGAGQADVVVSGIPLAPPFAEEAVSKMAARRSLGLDSSTATILLAFGGLGWEALDRIAEALLAAFPSVRFLAVAGKNRKMLLALESLKRSAGGLLTPFGYVNNMHELLWAADLIVAKCGGLTASECLATGVPMVIFNPIPGQEERNADFLLAGGAALRAHSSSDLIIKVKALLEEQSRLERMSRAARNLAQPQAARKIAAAIAGI